eukprot:2919923-Rhodomonas_salina.1
MARHCRALPSLLSLPLPHHACPLCTRPRSPAPPPRPLDGRGVGMVVLTDEGEVVLFSTALRAVLVSHVNGAPFTDMPGEALH